jgi:hypothetical protein
LPPLSEEELETLYKEVSAPPEAVQPRRRLGQLAEKSKIDQGFLRNLNVKFLDTQAEQELEEAKKQLEKDVKYIERITSDKESKALIERPITLNRMNQVLRISVSRTTDMYINCIQ